MDTESIPRVKCKRLSWSMDWLESTMSISTDTYTMFKCRREEDTQIV